MKNVLRIVLLVITTLTFIACSKDTNNAVTPTKGPTPTTAPVEELEKETLPSGHELKIGILPAEAAIPIILAKEKGFFDEEKVNVTIQAFSSPNDRNVAVQAKALDAVIGDVMTCAAFVDRGIALKITSDISEDFKILSSPDSGITKMEELGGKRISLVPNFILEYIMDEFAAEYGFTYEIVEIPSFSGRAEALMSNQIDGVLFTEPQAGMLVSQGAHLLGSSKERGIKGGTLQFTEDMLTSYAEDIKAFYRAYNKAIDYMNSTDVAEYSGILTNYQFPEAISNYLTGMIGEFQYAGSIDQNRFDKIIAWTKDKDLIGKTYTYEELTDFSFLP